MAFEIEGADSSLVVFSAVHNVGPNEPATLGKALIRQYLVYPLASFDIFGQ